MISITREIELALRRKRVRNCLISGLSVNEICKIEKVTAGTIMKDVKHIGREAFLEKEEQSAAVIFGALVEEVEWAKKEAKKMHENSKDYDRETGEHTGGRLDILKYLSDENRKLIEVAQALGLLDTMAEKTDVVHHLKIGAQEIKDYGDWLAVHMKKEE